MNKIKARPNHTRKAKQNDRSKLGKEDSMLLHFAKGESLHRFQAEPLGDHCLHTTVSDLQKKYSIVFARASVKVPNRFGSITTVKKYWLVSDNLLKAKKRFGLNDLTCSSFGGK